MFRVKIACVFLSMFCVCNFAYAEQTRPLVIASFESPPFHFTDEHGNVVGICVDIAKYIFDDLGTEIKAVSLPWARAWEMLKFGQIDGAFSVSRQKPREPYLLYPEENMWISEFVFFRINNSKYNHLKGSMQDIKLTGEKLLIERGASYYPGFWKVFPYNDGSDLYDLNNFNYNNQLVPVVDHNTMFKMLIYEREEFAIADKIVGQYIISNLGFNDKVGFCDTVIFSKPYPMPFSRQSDYPELNDIARKFDEKLKEMKKNGIYQLIVDRWIRS